MKSQKELLQQFKEIKKQILEMDDIKEYLFGFDYISWLNSKINGTSFQVEKQITFRNTVEA